MDIEFITLDALRYFLSKLKAAFSPASHASGGTEYGTASASLYGHAKASGTTPKANGTASAGTETSSFARGDHTHPKQIMEKATASTVGAVKPDGTTTTVDDAGYLKAVQMTRDQLWLASSRPGQYIETNGWDPTSIGGRWEKAPSMGPYTWLRLND